MLKQYWAVERVWSGEASFIKPECNRRVAHGRVWNEWELVAFGWRLFVALPA